MRRLAKQTRDDTYKSKRDYQSLHEGTARRYLPPGRPPFRLAFTADVARGPVERICWGGYAMLDGPVTVRATLTVGDKVASADLRLDRRWQRVGGLVIATDESARAHLVFEWNGGRALDLWGLGIGRPNVPVRNGSKPDLALLQQSHLVPETFYFPHATAIADNLTPGNSSRFRETDGPLIRLKKCSYCARLLPLDPDRPGGLSFHKHNDKRTGHQNECRACKKWRINDDLNEKRTTDQLHESSVITRERKVFLREPEILQKIKNRTGAGLKSQVWERFGRKCFRCTDPVALDDFQLDHTRPLAYLWPIDVHATCLCCRCNNEKKEKFPIDFYTLAQLKQLSRITGLSLKELRTKSLNHAELNRILQDLPRFSREWEPRTFAATARKVRELCPEIDLLERLRAADAAAWSRLTEELRDRPPPVDEE